jgi:ATP phosphoribosyltransferase
MITNEQTRTEWQDMAQAAELIFVPKGKDNKACRIALNELLGIEIPEQTSREEIKIRSQGIDFRYLKANSIPGFIGIPDPQNRMRLGVTGSDNCIEQNAPVRFQELGERMCRFSLLAPIDQVAVMADQLTISRRLSPTLEAVTSFPRLLSMAAMAKDIPVKPVVLPEWLTVSGSIETTLDLLGVPLAADIVNRGETAAKNNLTEIMSLYDVYPAIVWNPNDAN